ncbi:MAG: hypothetical protein CVV46_14375 [Spirochaetae bacterium HGW-Spirochaetae-2]|jgi:energy-coupling factor transporter transmembrane protein EcfT|nr:MAG: hypothetical protein CVV46_14375 [Spirochaetae bacterium HGW-Spirochaetae-2]
MITNRKTALEIGVNVLFITIAIGMFIVSADYKFVRGTLLGARTFPLLVGSIMMVFALINIFKTLGIQSSEENVEVEQALKELTKGKFNNWLRTYRVAAAIGLMVLYYLMMLAVGFIFATVIFLPAMLYLNEYRKPMKVIVVTIVGVAFLYISFKVLLGVPLPTAQLF